MGLIGKGCFRYRKKKVKTAVSLYSNFILLLLWRPFHCLIRVFCSVLFPFVTFYSFFIYLCILFMKQYLVLPLPSIIIFFRAYADFSSNCVSQIHSFEHKISVFFCLSLPTYSSSTYLK